MEEFSIGDKVIIINPKSRQNCKKGTIGGYDGNDMYCVVISTKGPWGEIFFKNELTIDNK